ncbi:MAG: glycosyltransferase family 39 protein [Victivallales bacterium]|nr:glycosyltransferase family 39 protein [Victivallales bacterium]
MASKKNIVLLLTVITALLISSLHIFRCIDIYDDIAGWYAPMVRAFARSQWHNAFEVSVPILSSSLAGMFARGGMEPFQALVLVSCLFYLVSIPLLYYILEYFLQKGEYAAWGCLLYVLAPKIIRFSCTGLLNPAKNFFILAAVALILASIKHPRWIYTLLLGIVSAGLALARAETLIFLPPLVLWYAYFMFRSPNLESGNRLLLIFAHCLTITLIFFACVSPRLIQTWSIAGVPVLDIRQSGYVTAVLPFSRREYIPRINIKAECKVQVPNPKSRTSLEMLWQGVECFVRGAYTPYLLLALPGLFLWWKRKKFRAEGFMLLSLIAINTAVLITISNSVRYYTLTLLLLLPFTFSGLKFFWDSTSRRRLYRYPLIAVLAIIALLQIYNGMKKVVQHDYDYEYQVGNWIKQNKNALYPSAERLIIAGTQPQYPYWADATWLNISDNKLQFPEQLGAVRTAGFVVLEKDQREVIAILKQQRDFKLLEQIHPNVFVFLNTRGKR